MKQLEYFVRVAELGSFTKAAVALSMAQPSLSKQIRALEVDLRHSLLTRNGRGIGLTEEGSHLLTRARNILDQIEKLPQEIGDITDSPVGKVLIGIPVATGKRVVAKLVKAFAERFPRASLEIVEAKTVTVYERILNGSMDVGIVFDPHYSPLVEVTPVIRQPVYFVSAAKKKVLPKSRHISLKQVAAFPLMLPSYPHKMRWLVESVAAEANVKLNICQQVEGVAFLLELVYLGHGYTLLTKNLVEESNLRDKLQTNLIIKPRIERTLGLAVSSQRRSTYLVSETLSLIRYYLLMDASQKEATA